MNNDVEKLEVWIELLIWVEELDGLIVLLIKGVVLEVWIELLINLVEDWIGFDVVIAGELELCLLLEFKVLPVLEEFGILVLVEELDIKVEDEINGVVAIVIGDVVGKNVGLLEVLISDVVEETKFDIECDVFFVDEIVGSHSLWI